MPPKKHQTVTYYDNGAIETTFEANPRPSNRKTKRGGKVKDTTTADDDGVVPMFIDPNTTPKRQRGRKAQHKRAAVAVAATTATAITTRADTAVAATPTDTAATAATASNTTATATPADTTDPATTTAATATTPITNTAAAAITPTIIPDMIDEENPLIEQLAYNQLAPAAASLEACLSALHLHSTSASGPYRNQDTSTDVAAASQKNRKEARDVKTFFLRENARSYCKYCDRDHAASPQHSRHSYKASCATTTLRRHLFSKHRIEWFTACKKASIEITATSNDIRKALDEFNHGYDDDDPISQGDCTPIRRTYNPGAFLDAIVKWIVADDQSLNVIENTHLRSIFLMLRPEFCNKDIPHRMKIRKHIMNTWYSHIQELEKRMKRALGKISFTADCWSDSNLMSFMAITGHWTDSHTKNTSHGPRDIIALRSELIAFSRVPRRHTGEHLATVFMSILCRYKLKKIGWITLDNASNNDTLLMSLGAQLNAQGVEFSYDEQHIRCFPHIVNLAVQAVLSSITDITYAEENANTSDPWLLRHDVVALLRTLINKIRASGLRRQEFAEVQMQCYKINPALRLIRDVPTRWSSTHLMISRALQLQQAIDIFISKNTDMADYRLSAEDWAQIRAFAKILEVPHAFQQKLSSEKTPTLCEALPSFLQMFAKWKELQEAMPNYAPFINAGLLKLQDYFSRAMQVPAYQLAILLHPEKKLSWFIDHLPGQISNVQEMFLKFLRPYYQSSMHPSTPRPQRIVNDAEASEFAWADGILGIGVTRGVHRRSLQAEVDAYLHDTITSSYPSVMLFWQENQLCYPTIFMLAMDVLAIQGSSVPCERVFSSGKETMSARRSQIKYDLMEALQMLKFSIHNGELDFTVGSGRKSELQELEELDILHSMVPEDLTTFRCSSFLFTQKDSNTSSLTEESDPGDDSFGFFSS